MAIGFTPPNGFATPDGDWLNGIAGGHNRTYQSGISAAGTSSQATATQLTPRIAIVEVDTAAANSGVALPPALKGIELKLYNNGASNLTVYPSIANNPITAAQDTINNATSVTVNTKTGKTFFCAKDGIWGAV